MSDDLIGDPTNASDAAADAASAMPDSPPGAVTPCAAAVGGGGAAASPPANPCAGQGMANDTSEKAFRDGFKKLQTDWSKLTVDQRQQKLATLVNAALAPSGAPTVGIRPLLSASDAGNFDFPAWRLNLGDANLKSATLPDAAAKEFAGTVYHETRHAEQWYLMARKRAGEGKTADEITTELGIPKSVAENAVKAPLKRDDLRHACATSLYDSVYGANKAHREDVLREIRQAKVDVTAAQQDYERINADPKATAAQKQAASLRWQQSYASFQTAYGKYKALPEEADAWASGDNVVNNW